MIKDMHKVSQVSVHDIYSTTCIVAGLCEQLHGLSYKALQALCLHCGAAHHRCAITLMSASY